MGVSGGLLDRLSFLNRGLEVSATRARASAGTDTWTLPTYRTSG